ncbi:MAG: hypothetical protein K0V04_16770 [Deltaproteobacteria bacterium]|nr:hypothetical protein [Deltaproteobacteria bacterium]
MGSWMVGPGCTADDATTLDPPLEQPREDEDGATQAPSPVWWPMSLGNHWIFTQQPGGGNRPEMSHCDGLAGTRMALVVEPSDAAFRSGSSRILHYYKEHHCGYHWPARGDHPWILGQAGPRSTNLRYHVAPPSEWDGHTWLSFRGWEARGRAMTPQGLALSDHLLASYRASGFYPGTLHDAHNIDIHVRPLEAPFARPYRFAADESLPADEPIAHVTTLGSNQPGAPPPYNYFPLDGEPYDNPQGWDMAQSFRLATMGGGELGPGNGLPFHAIRDLGPTPDSLLHGHWFVENTVMPLVTNGQVLAPLQGTALALQPLASLEGRRVLQWHVFELVDHSPVAPHPDSTLGANACEIYWFVEGIGLARIDETTTATGSQCLQYDFDGGSATASTLLLSEYAVKDTSARPDTLGRWGFDAPTAITTMNYGTEPHLWIMANGWVWDYALDTGDLGVFDRIADRWADAPVVMIDGQPVHPADGDGPDAIEAGPQVAALLGAPVVVVKSGAYWLHDGTAWSESGPLAELWPSPPPGWQDQHLDQPGTIRGISKAYWDPSQLVVLSDRAYWLLTPLGWEVVDALTWDTLPGAVRGGTTAGTRVDAVTAGHFIEHGSGSEQMLVAEDGTTFVLHGVPPRFVEQP